MRCGRIPKALSPTGPSASPTRRYPPIEHVIYVIKENRTYDQIFGDLPAGDGDTSLLFFPRPVTPNHHALAERFGLFDRFFVNAEVSTDGHNWSTASYATDYVQKTTPSQYSNHGRSYDYTGTTRDSLPEDDIAELGEFKKVGRMPALEIVWLPNDHTAGLRAGSPTPAVYMADNDLALGRWSKRSRKPRFGRPP